MYAMQYEITLPADYDMRIIRERVATRGHALDDFEGLGFKAYLIRERAAGSPVNQYAPFYLWDDTGGMNRFLWGGAGFAGIVRDFGRPAVHHWTGVQWERGPAHGASPPRAASRYVRAIPALEDPSAAVTKAAEELAARARMPGVYATVLAVDPRHWEMVHFTLWQESVEEVGGDHYEVLHLSRPQLDEVKTGRPW
ncbi:DUF4865 family protein [Bailinhaonella thermotolerans]|uniref:DUF4865 family protein n=1 Tax=Bailinhaonella thermotolerans TaxID=1070861 RepID=A0A3A4B1R8_9ACTN|nr:DUF4865 family protein [Bailinhaonella thermotolerans]RJL31967.1 DUF4865 family protein [Bailinhaonella thermotolerans]